MSEKRSESPESLPDESLPKKSSGEKEAATSGNKISELARKHMSARKASKGQEPQPGAPDGHVLEGRSVSPPRVESKTTGHVAAKTGHVRASPKPLPHASGHQMPMGT
jgi:hypothetical protein